MKLKLSENSQQQLLFKSPHSNSHFYWTFWCVMINFKLIQFQNTHSQSTSKQNAQFFYIVISERSKPSFIYSGYNISNLNRGPLLEFIFPIFQQKFIYCCHKQHPSQNHKQSCVEYPLTRKQVNSFSNWQLITISHSLLIWPIYLFKIPHCISNLPYPPSLHRMGRIIQHFYGTPKAPTNKGKLSNLLYPRIMKWGKTATWFQQQYLGPSGITENLSFCFVTTKQYGILLIAIAINLQKMGSASSSEPNWKSLSYPAHKSFLFAQ